ncbi:helix-turn-helix domain-containing protein [Longimicrobium sp.]|uniref:helix-turn-helix domain-containing protein n=1 Tax=Longimicrobium sp. TaxID=2029185 RepID=UPI003B3AF25C
MRLRTAREIGLLVRTERKRQGLTMQDVAERVGCSRQWVAALEAGSERLEIALVLRTLAALGVRLDARSQHEPAREGAQ